MPLNLPGTSTPFLTVRGTSTPNSSFQLRRSATGVFSATLTNMFLDVLGQTIGPVSAAASSAGLVSMSLVQSSPFALGPFDWESSGTNPLAWNIRDGSFGFTLAAGPAQPPINMVPA